MTVKKLKELNKGAWFTRKPIEYPTESQVYIRGGYDRASKTYGCVHWNDTCKEIFLKGDTVVYVDFTF